ncbi:hypothetical protein M4I32_05085 [Microbacterium sp. LRZ72]|uniref:hypothetical protein n=1 Tax=Microbacterium sp. LRZ72 TaxID=2942481 RepID=UPI0029A15390|nr:hypothetical protein [Microbacterium sp. LRZ72]MDX2376172.1 hypothetical protein [Microbacterium sp. LRZ72]
MPIDAGALFCREQRARDRLEELRRGIGLERGDVGHIDDGRGVSHRVVEAGAGGQMDPA